MSQCVRTAWQQAHSCDSWAFVNRRHFGLLQWPVASGGRGGCRWSHQCCAFSLGVLLLLSMVFFCGPVGQPHSFHTAPPSHTTRYQCLFFVCEQALNARLHQATHNKFITPWGGQENGVWVYLGTECGVARSPVRVRNKALKKTFVHLSSSLPPPEPQRVAQGGADRGSSVSSVGQKGVLLDRSVVTILNRFTGPAARRQVASGRYSGWCRGFF